MEIPRITNGFKNNESNINSERHTEQEENTKKNKELPFLIIDTEKNREYPNISKRLEKAKLLINSQTDKLLIEGFEGNEEDFKKCYHKLIPTKMVKISNIKHRKLNKLLIKEGRMGTIRLTKTKEFNFTAKRRDKLLAQFSPSGLGQYKNLKLKKLNKNRFNYLFLDSSSHKSNPINSSNSINERNIYNYSGSINTNNLLNKSDSNSINKNYGSTFYFYKSKHERKNNSMKNIKKRSINTNAFHTLRNILNDTSHNVSTIDNELKKFIKNNTLNFKVLNTTKNKNKTSRFFHLKQSQDSKLKELLDSFKKKEENAVKLIKKDEGVNSQNIWIKKSTANLITFGKAFLNLDDNQFYQERKRILDDYPKLVKEANIEEADIKQEENKFLKETKLKMDKNSRKMNDLNNMNNFIYQKIKKKLKEMKEQK